MKTSSSLGFLFTTVDGGGNVAPAMTVVRELVKRGHRVRVLSDPASEGEVSAAGATLLPWVRAPGKPDRSREAELIRDWAAATPQEGLQQVLALICGRALDYAHDVFEALEREPADLVVSFDMMLGVMAGCESRAQKLALLSTSLSMYPIPGVPPFGPGLVPATSDAERALHAEIAAATTAMLDEGLPALNGARSALGLPPLAHLHDQIDCAEVYWLGTARAFDFHTDSLPPRLRYAGPLVGDPSWVKPWQSPWPAHDSRPLVLVSFSTSFQNHVSCLQRVIDACASLPVRVLVTLGGPVLAEELSPAGNTKIVDSAPHNLVMPEASLVITHGGHGTVITALVHGLPMLVIPHGRDQADNAARVVARGAGLSLTASASVNEMRDAVQRLLAGAPFRDAARRLGEAVVAEARGSTLIDELEQLAQSNGSRMRPSEPSVSGGAVLDRRATLKGLVATAVGASFGVSPRILRAASSRNANRVNFSALRRSIGGEVIPIDSPTYAAARETLTWNMRKTGRRPLAIVRVRSAKDACAAVRFAVAHDLKVAVRGGGHNYFNSPVRDGGLLLDLSALNAFKIDAPKRRASVQPAVKSGALVAALTPLGLAFPVGHCSDVSLSGFLLNGGIGWNVGAWGPSCLSVQGVELVTAGGDLIYADAQHHPDLFWAARGAGPGFFGVVTRYDIVLRELPRAIGVRSVIFDASSIDDVSDWLAEIAAAAPPQLEVICAMGANGMPAVAGKPSSSLLVALIAFADSESQARQWLAPIDGFPRKAKVVLQTPYEPATFETLQAMNDAEFPNGCRFAGDSCWSDATPGQLLNAVRKVAFSPPSPRAFSFLGLNAVRGRPEGSAPDAAFSMWGSVLLGAYGFWDEPREDRENMDWVQSLLRSAEPLMTGYYVGEADLAIEPTRASRCFSASAWQRLTALKKQHDPGDLFFSYLQNG